jgi:hypothetical protein
MTGATLRFTLRCGNGAEAALAAGTTTDATPRDAVQHALALEPLLPLLQAVQDGLGVCWQSIEPAAPDAPWPDAAQALTLSCGSAGDVEETAAHARLALPGSALRPGAAWAAPGWVIEWPDVACELVLDLPPPHLATERLEPGATLLLAGTFDEAPRGAMARALGPGCARWPWLHGLPWPGVDDAAALPTALRAPAADTPWRVVGESAIRLDAGCWFGASLPPRSTSRVDRAALCSGVDGEPIARGRVVALGRGFGLLIDGKG